MTRDSRSAEWQEESLGLGTLIGHHLGKGDDQPSEPLDLSAGALDVDTDQRSPSHSMT